MSGLRYHIEAVVGVIGLTEEKGEAAIRLMMQRVADQVVETYRRDRLEWGPGIEFHWEVTANEEQ